MEWVVESSKGNLPVFVCGGHRRTLFEVLGFLNYKGCYLPTWGQAEWKDPTVCRPSTKRGQYAFAKKALGNLLAHDLRRLFGLEEAASSPGQEDSDENECMDTTEERIVDHEEFDDLSMVPDDDVMVETHSEPSPFPTLECGPGRSADHPEATCRIIQDGPLHDDVNSDPEEEEDEPFFFPSPCRGGHQVCVRRGEDDGESLSVDELQESDDDLESLCEDLGDCEISITSEVELSEVLEDPGEPPVLEVHLEEEGCDSDLHENFVEGSLDEIPDKESADFFDGQLLFSEFIRDWALRNHVTDQAIEDLIAGLKKEKPIYDVETMPATWRSLAKLTKRDKAVFMHRKITTVSSDSPSGQNIAEEYTHFGVVNMMRRYRQRILDAMYPDGQQPRSPHFKNDFWTDGVPLGKSGRYNQLWPLKMQVVSVADRVGGTERVIPYQLLSPIMIGVYLGTHKPSHSSHLLSDLVDELILLDPDPRSDRNQETVSKLHEEFTVSLDAGKADKVARAFCKETKGHSSKQPCDHCDAPAVKVQGLTGMSVYKVFNLNLREDHKFLEYQGYLREFVADKATGRMVPNPPSPLCKLGYFGMVTGFPLDTMHLLYKNIVPNFLSYLMEGLNRRIPGTRSTKAEVLDSRISVVANFCPDEFNRKVSPTEFVKQWKATEVRQFFLYLAYPLFEDLVDEEPLRLLRYLQYYVYLIGGTSRTPVPAEDLEFAQQIIEYFVSSFICERRTKTARSTLHDALHLVRQCLTRGVHADVHAVWREENSVRHLTRSVRSGNAKLRQIETKYLERQKYLFLRDENGRILRNSVGEPVYERNAVDSIRNQRSQPPFFYGIDRFKTKKLKFPDFLLSTKFRDSFCLINPRDSGATRQPLILRIRDILRDPGCGSEMDGVRLVGNIYRRKTDLFKTPAPSQLKHVYVFSDPCSQLSAWSISAIVGKLYVFPRFSALRDDDFLRCVTVDDLGEGYENVHEWVGILERHIGQQEGNTFY